MVFPHPNQHLYHIRQLRKFGASPTILCSFPSATVESILPQCMTSWYGNSHEQDRKALQRVIRAADRSALLSLPDLYGKRCWSRAARIIKDSSYLGNSLFRPLKSGKRYRSIMARIERLFIHKPLGF